MKLKENEQVQVLDVVGGAEQSMQIWERKGII